MTRDYKNSPTRASRTGGSGKTVITGIIIGLLMGIVIALGIALFLNRSPSPFANKTQQPQPRPSGEARRQSELKAPPMTASEISQASPSPKSPLDKARDSRSPDTKAKDAKAKEAQAAEANATEMKPGDKQRFDFYEILPGEKDPSPRPVEKAVPGDKAAREAPASPRLTEKPAEKPASKTPAGKDIYYVQAGSFRSASDADNLKARLALMGMQANVSAADVPNVGTMHRVRVGPYRSTDEVNPVKGQLAQNGIQASVVKLPPRSLSGQSN